MNDEQKPPKDPFEFFESPWWTDANKTLCQDGWPSYVVALNCMVRDAKAAFDKLCAERDILQRRLDVAVDALKECKKFEPFHNPKCNTFIKAISHNGPKIWLTPATDALAALDTELTRDGAKGE